MSTRTPHEEADTPTPPGTPTDAAARLPTDANKHADSQTPTNGVGGPQNGTQGVTSMLAPFKARAEAATEGPWTSYGDLGHEVFQIEDGEPVAFDIPEAADAVFIAAARTDIPRLLGALEAMEDWLKNLDAIEEVDPASPTNRNVCAGAVAESIRAAVVAALGEDK